MVLVRHTANTQSHSLELLDISETGFSFKLNPEHQIFELEDVLIVDLKQINNGHSTEFTARIVRTVIKGEEVIYGAKFIHIPKNFTEKVNQWAKVYMSTGAFLVERRSPASIALRTVQTPLALISLAIQEIRWQLANYDHKSVEIKSPREMANSNLTTCMDFDQI